MKTLATFCFLAIIAVVPPALAHDMRHKASPDRRAKHLNSLEGRALVCIWISLTMLLA